MNLQNFRIEKQQTPDNDYKVYGDIVDDFSNVLATFGDDGTSINQWWIRQDEQFKDSYLRQFAIIMAQEILSGQAE
jgi:hypothetical protein